MNLCKEIQGEFKTLKYNCFYFHYQNQYFQITIIYHSSKAKLSSLILSWKGNFKSISLPWGNNFCFMENEGAAAKPERHMV